MPRILLVDDEPLVTRTLQTLILDDMPDIEVSAVDSPAEALHTRQAHACIPARCNLTIPKLQRGLTAYVI